MKNKLWVYFLIFLIGFCAFFFNYAYEDAKKAAIKDLNEKQFSHARQADIGIEDYFKHWTNLLQSITHLDGVANLNETGKKYLSFTYETNRDDITALTRVDGRGRIIYTAPFTPKAIGQDISGQRHIQEAMRTHKPVVSDVFKSVQGFDMVALHVPVLKNGIYQGTIGIGINFQNLAKRYLEGIRIGKTGYAWMISRDGKELYCPVPGHTGNSVYDNCKDYPEIIAMAEEMVKGKEGVTTYTFDQIRDRKVELVKKHAVYMPIPVGQTFWSIVVASSESEVLSSLEGFRNRLLLIMGLFLLGGATFSFYGLRGWFIVREEQKRRQAEEALQKSEQRFRAIFDSTFQFTGLMTPDGMLIEANQAALDFAGIRLEDIVNRPFWEARWWRGNENRVRQLKEAIARAARGEFIRYEAELQGAGDKTAMIDFSLKPVLGQTGEVTLLIPEGRDITEQKQAEAALRESENQYRTIFINAIEGIFQTTPEGRYRSVNPAFAFMFGYESPEEMKTGVTNIGEQLYVNPDDRMRLIEKMKVSEGMVREFEVQLRRKDGSVFWVSINARMVKDEGGEAPFLEGTCMDITDRKHAEEALQETRRRLADIIEFLPDATLVIDREGRVIAWNRAIESMTGVRSEEMLGKGNYEYSLPFYGERKPILIDLALHPDPEREKAYTTIQRKGDIVIGEAYTPALVLGNVHLSATASVLRDSRGEIIAAIECIRNNTDRKNMEERLQRAEKMEALGVLAGGVAHDMNNVLGVLVGYSELLLREVPEEGRAGKYAKNLLQGSERAAAIIQDLLTLARRGVSISITVNLNRIVTEFLSTPEFEHLKLHHPDVLFRSQLEASLLNIKGSPVHLFKTIMNLLSNAAESIRGAGEVAIKTENRYVDVPIPGYENTQEGEYVVLTISDTGSGISPADLGHIFEPFYTKKVMARSGTGLGLAVVWGTVKDHGGYIDVRSEENKGSTFTLYFPASRDALSKMVKDLSPDSYQGSGESILIVDDVDAQRTLAATILENLNYRVATAASGEEAVEYLKANKADLIVLDMIMDPGIDGLETYRRILKIMPQQKAIIVSGFAKTDRVRAAQELGAGEYLKKPYVIEQLGMAVRRELDG